MTDAPAPDAPPRIAVALPVYNGADYLAQTLDALRAQTETRWVALVTDNASTDATPEIVRQAAAADGRIRYARNATNLGANGNFNRSMALAVATGAPFVKWAAHDDFPHPGYLAACLAAARRPPRSRRRALGDPAGRRRRRPYPFAAADGGFLAPDGVGLDARVGGGARQRPPGTPAAPLSACQAGPVDGLRRVSGRGRRREPAVRHAGRRGRAVRRAAPARTDGVRSRSRCSTIDHHAGSARHLSRRDYIEYETGVRPDRACRRRRRPAALPTSPAPSAACRWRRATGSGRGRPSRGSPPAPTAPQLGGPGP